MVVDDSLTYRNLLRDVFSHDPEIKLIGTAMNGKLALPKIRLSAPDIILLDQEMPEMTGLEALEYIRKENVRSKVIMLSSHTVKGAKVTLRALELGAADFITKPEGGLAHLIEFIEKELIPKIKGLWEKTAIQYTEKIDTPVTRIHPGTSKKNFAEVCAIGISTGGPVALRVLFSHLSQEYTGTIFIAQHMPTLFTEYLAESLSEISPIPVIEARDGMTVAPAMAYIAPGGRQMLIEKFGNGHKIRITDLPEEKLCKPSVNALFRSVADSYGEKAIGIIMTGMGEDGYLGLQKMKNSGSYLLGQSRETCSIYGMPARPEREGLLDEVLSIRELAEKIYSLSRKNHI